jgi:hypothetical protein
MENVIIVWAKKDNMKYTALCREKTEKKFSKYIVD